MTAQTKTTLKTYFNTGDVPTESQFGDQIDTFASLSEANTFAAAQVFSSTTEFEGIATVGNAPIASDRTLLQFATADATIKFRAYSSSFTAFTHRDDTIGFTFDQDAPNSKPQWGLQFEHDYYTSASAHQAEIYYLWQMGAVQRRPFGIAVENDGVGNTVQVTAAGIFRVYTVDNSAYKFTVDPTQYVTTELRLILDGRPGSATTSPAIFYRHVDSGDQPVLELYNNYDAGAGGAAIYLGAHPDNPQFSARIITSYNQSSALGASLELKVHKPTATAEDFQRVFLANRYGMINLSAPDVAEMPSGDMDLSSVNFYLNESSSIFVVKAKLASGAIKYGTLALS